MAHRDAAVAVPGEDAEGDHLHVGRELGLDAQRVDPLLAAELAEAERAVVVEARALGEAARTLPVVARGGEGERSEWSVASARHRLARREAGVRLRERLRAVVGIEADRGPDPALRVDLCETQVLELRGAPVGCAGPQRTIERDAVAGRPDQLARHRPQAHGAVVLDPHLDAAAHERAPAAVLEAEIRAREG